MPVQPLTECGDRVVREMEQGRAYVGVDVDQALRDAVDLANDRLSRLCRDDCLLEPPEDELGLPSAGASEL
ncbi:hypothetical protein ACIOUE_39010 [Streptomyces xanthochromogenes]|uniref:hypothetical protein n=1 Tax=Streptomyces xanthochromogenes TaxID=67384 RepID=UPI00380B1B54